MQELSNSDTLLAELCKATISSYEVRRTCYVKVR